MENDALFAMSVAVIVAVVYLVILRLIDLNEKEPLWALGLVLFVGLIVSVIVTAVVDPSFRVLSTVGSAVTSEVSKFIAVAIGLAVLEGVGRARGWSEFNGVVDGIVYGAAAGLGYAVGETLVRELGMGATASQVGGATSPFGLIWTTVLFGLRDGLFGAIIGAGFGAALVRRVGAARYLLPFLGLLVAIAVSVGYFAFDSGNSLSGSLIRPLIALLLPVVLIAVLMVQGLARERRAIADELADEAGAGVVSEEELRLLRSPGARRRQYFGRIAKGDLDGWLSSRSLHNRQVQLALTERRSRNESDAGHKREIDAEVAKLRASILEMKQRLAPPTAPATERGAA